MPKDTYIGPVVGNAISNDPLDLTMGGHRRDKQQDTRRNDGGSNQSEKTHSEAGNE